MKSPSAALPVRLADQGDGVAPAPRPTRLAGLVEHDVVERHRSLLCSSYDACLDEAFRNRWASWTCERCPLFRLAAGFRTLRIAHEGALRPEA